MTNYKKFHEIDENPETNSHLAEIIDSIQTNGWQGLPLLAIGDQLINGAHRATACEILGIEPEVHEMEIGEPQDEYQQFFVDEIASAFDTEGFLKIIRLLHDEGLVDDYSLEIIEAEWNNEV